MKQEEEEEEEEEKRKGDNGKLVFHFVTYLY